MEFRGFPELHAPFLNERRTRGPVQISVQEIRGISLVFREMWDTAGPSPSRSPQLSRGAPCSHQRCPDFLLSSTSRDRACGFLSKKAAGSISKPPSSTGNSGYVGRKRWATPDFLLRAASRATCAALLKESRRKSINATGLHRKSGGSPSTAFSSSQTVCSSGALSPSIRP